MKNKKIETIEELNARIEASNKKFKSMSKKDKRITVAEDCLIRLKIKQLKPKANRFLHPETFEKYAYNNSLVGVKEVLEAPTFKCTACAKGALFLSYIGRVNNFEINDLCGDNSRFDRDHEKIAEIFSLSQLSVIEYAFEGNQFLYLDENGKSIIITNKDAINEWRKQFLINKDYPEGMNDEDKDYKQPALLRAICMNIIKNDGEFII